jgi:hypothetical protein
LGAAQLGTRRLPILLKFIIGEFPRGYVFEKVGLLVHFPQKTSICGCILWKGVYIENLKLIGYLLTSWRENEVILKSGTAKVVFRCTHELFD